MIPVESNLSFHCYDEDDFSVGVPEITPSSIRIPASEFFIEESSASEYVPYLRENYHERAFLIFDDVVSSTRGVWEIAKADSRWVPRSTRNLFDFARVESEGVGKGREMITDGPFLPLSAERA